MPTVRHARGTRAALNALASSGLLVPWQLYVLSDENRVAIATSTSTYQAFAKEGEGGGAAYSAQLVFANAIYGEGMVTVANEAATATSSVLCWFVPNDDWEADDLLDLRVQGVSGDNSVSFHIFRNGPIVGILDVAYLLR